MNEIVKYSNELHELKFSSLTEAQQNVFFMILQQFRNTEGCTLELDFNKIFELADIPRNTDYRHEILNKLGKLQEFKFRYQINDLGDLQQDVIFPSIATDTQNKKLYIKVSKGFKDRYINSHLKGWTRYELAEFVGLSGSYTKTIYRYLKQFKTQGRWRIGYKDFKELLGIPESYQACNIEQRILKPAIKELTKPRNLFEQKRTPFENLSVKKHKKGREILSLEFTFIPQSPTILEKDKQQCERNLETIAHDIKREQAIKKLKNLNQASKTSDFENYLYRNMSFQNQFGEWDILKITNITQESSGKIIVTLKNMDDDFITNKEYDNLKHFENIFSKYEA